MQRPRTWQGLGLALLLALPRLAPAAPETSHSHAEHADGTVARVATTVANRARALRRPTRVRRALSRARVSGHDEVERLAHTPIAPPFTTPVTPAEIPGGVTAPLARPIVLAAEATLRDDWRGTYTAPSVRRPSTREDPLDPAEGWKTRDIHPLVRRFPKLARRFPGLARHLRAPMKYPRQWLWDSGLHITVLTSLGQYAHARTELASMLARQSPDGFIPDMSGTVAKCTVKITQPPVLAEAALGLMHAQAVAPESALPQGTYERLRAFHEYLHARRESDGLVSMQNGLESGRDTSPVFDQAHWGNPKGGRLSRAKYTLSRAYYDLYGVIAPRPLPRPNMRVRSLGFNALYARDLEAMATLADALGHPADAAEYRGRYAALRRTMRARMRVGPGGHLFYSLGRNGEPVMIATAEMFQALYAGLLEEDEAARFIAYATDPENGFWFGERHDGREVRFPLPSVSINEPSYHAGDYWRGSAWFRDAAFAIRGFLRYGAYRPAVQLYERLLARFPAQPGPMDFNENNHAESGEPMRQGQFTWPTEIVSLQQVLRTYERDHGVRP